MPPVERIDMRAEGTRLFSRRMRVAVADAVAAGGQVILFLNRRGFSTLVVCARCKETLGCPRCSSMLVFHKGRRRTACHLCGQESTVPSRCAACGGNELLFVGSGTERVAEEAAEAWRDVPIVRVDSDSVRGDEIEQALETFRTGAAKILVGTQMVAKGLHFPSVTLVGIVNADTALHLPDFRSNERTFHLIAQVAGRAGRGVRGGRVLVQTFHPDHYAVEAAARHDYEGFARKELEERALCGLPPERRAAVLLLSSKSDDLCRAAAERLLLAVRPAAGEHGVEVRGPAYAPIQRVKERWRRMLLCLCAQPRGIAAVCAAARRFRPGSKVDLTIDVDPAAVL
jgi:primosomal protein N' (replication factor Y)